jgi:hypothetical protein
MGYITSSTTRYLYFAEYLLTFFIDINLQIRSKNGQLNGSEKTGCSSSYYGNFFSHGLSESSGLNRMIKKAGSFVSGFSFIS